MILFEIIKIKLNRIYKVKIKNILVLISKKHNFTKIQNNFKIFAFNSLINLKIE